MKTRRIVILALTGMVVLALIVAAAMVWARAYNQGEKSFNSNGALISGWYWLRASGHTATWTFDASALQGAKPNSVYLNFTPLCTNAANGGSGYDTTVKLIVTGNKPHTASISLVNPYRPIDPEHSHGIGYQCYGHSSSLPKGLWQGASTIKVVASFPFPNGRHVAVNANCLSIGYSK